MDEIQKLSTKRDGLKVFQECEKISRTDFIEKSEGTQGNTGEGGNTKAPSPVKNPGEPIGTQRKSKVRGTGSYTAVWLLTFNNPKMGLPHLMNAVANRCARNKGYCGQGEIGKKGLFHYHMLIRFENRVYFSALKANLCAFGNPRLDAVMHEDAAMAYVTKVRTRTIDPIGVGCYANVPKPPIRVRKCILRKDLWKWQDDLYEYLTSTPPDNRTILWYWSKEGGCGKTTMKQFMKQQHPTETAVMRGGKVADTAFMLNTRIKAGDDIKYVFIDLPRSKFETGHIYGLAEQLKDGDLDCSKYESCELQFAEVHVIVFANWYPDMNNQFISSDRMHVVCMDGCTSENEPEPCFLDLE